MINAYPLIFSPYLFFVSLRSFIAHIPCKFYDIQDFIISRPQFSMNLNCRINELFNQLFQSFRWLSHRLFL